MTFPSQMHPAISHPATSIPLCHHLKTNKTLCASPTLPHQKLCYFHQRWHRRQKKTNANLLRRRIKTLKLKLSHQSFIKVAKVNLTQLSIQKRIDRPTLALLQQGLRTASLNAKHTSWQTSPSGDQPANIQLISTMELKFKRVRLPPGSGL
jgi:hypothetical protein